MKFGTIILWYGALIDIPQGWHVCDGSVGTPNMGIKFAPGAGNHYAVNDVGGAGSHYHNFTADGHNHFLPATPLNMSPGAWDPHITNVQSLVGNTNLGFHVPPWHALFYIQKMTPERPTEGY